MYSSRGNALFLILIAVALFAALSYAVTQSGRGGGAGADKEKLGLEVSQALSTMQSFKWKIDRMRALNGVSDTQISFQGPYPNWVNTLYANANCIGTNCAFFSPDGGDATYIEPPAALLSRCAANCPIVGGTHAMWTFSGAVQIPGVGTNAQPELIVSVRVDQATCMAANRIAGIPNPSGAPPQLPSTWTHFDQIFDGNYSANGLMPAELTGKTFGCVNIQHSYYSDNFAWLYLVLIER